MKLNYEQLGKRIRATRKYKGYTLEQLSYMTELSITHLGNIETGKSKCSLGALVIIANALDTTLDALLYDSLKAVYDAYDRDFKDLLDDCTSEQKAFLLDIVRTVKKGIVNISV